MNPVAPRVVIEGVDPEIDGGQFPIKRTVGEELEVRADAFADGHDPLAVVLRYRHAGSPDWTEATHDAAGQRPLVRPVPSAGTGPLRVHLASVDRPLCHLAQGVVKKAEAGQDVASELLEGAELVAQAARQAPPAEGHWIRERAVVMGGKTDQAIRVQAALDAAAGGGHGPQRGSQPRHGL